MTLRLQVKLWWPPTPGTETPTGYADSFTITLKSGATVTQGDQISVDGSQVIDQNGTTASSNVVFTLADITPPEASGEAVSSDEDSSNTFNEGDTLTINFNEGIQVSEITNTDLDTNITLSGTGTTFGTGATITAVSAVGGLATQFVITLGTGTDIVDGDTISVGVSQILDEADNSPSTAQTFTILGTNIPSIASITIPDGAYLSGDKVTVSFAFSEDVTVNLNGGTMSLKPQCRWL